MQLEEAQPEEESVEAGEVTSVAEGRINDATVDVLELMEQAEERASDLAGGQGSGNQSVEERVEERCRVEIERFADAQRQQFCRTVNGKEIRNNPLDWWREREGDFPTLARLARMFLSVQPTSAPSERIFSAASRLLSQKRTNMDPDFAGKAFFVSRNWDWFERKAGTLLQVDLAEADSESN